MFKMKKILFSVLKIFVVAAPLISYEFNREGIFGNGDSSHKYRKMYNLSVCAVFKNEAPFLKEWIEYHRLLGVDHFYLYSIGSHDSLETIVMPYVKQQLVTFINWPEAMSYPGDELAYQWALSTQIPAYENAVNFIAKYETKWLVLMDINEFLVCPKGSSLAELLQLYDDYAGISISTDFFDASIPSKSKNTLVVQTLALARPPIKVVEKSVSKMIFKPDLCMGFTWPPYQCRFAGDQIPVSNLDREDLRINCYVNRHVKRPPFKQHWLYIDHRFLSEEETATLLDEGYLLEDRERPIYQLIPELIKKLKKK